MGEFEIESCGSHMGCFLIMINVIFEKTYFVQDDFEDFFSQWEKIKNSQSMYNRRFNIVGTTRLLIS